MEITRNQYKEAVKIVNQYKKQLEKELQELNKIPIYENPIKGNVLISELDITVRLRNILYSYFEFRDIDRSKITLNDVSLLRYNTVKRMRNIGKKSLQELQEVLIKHGLSPIK